MAVLEGGEWDRTSGQVVTDVRFDYGCSITTDRGTELTIGAAFTVQTETGGAHLVDPDDDAHHDAVRQFVGQSVRALSATIGGRLVVALSGGDTIVIEPAYDFEAWSIEAPNGFIAIALPGGGGVATWGGEPSEIVSAHSEL